MSSFEKIPMGILDKVENNKQIFIAEFKDKLQEVFPSAVKDGIVDFEALLNEFGKYAETDEKEKYNMTWVGKKEAIKTANEDIIGKTLKYVSEDSKDPETTQNLYIEGDNLEVLKLLRNSYYGKIKMIYIDPPYNTENDFIYKDNFKIDKEKYEKLEGSIDEYNERLTASKKGSGRYHSDWMNMMYPRLKVAKDLLSDDGVILISIDDNEVVNLKKICDEIFGEENFIANLVWEKKKKGSFLAKSITNIKEHILVFSKVKDYFDGLIGEINDNQETYPCVNASNKREIRIIPKGIISKFKEKDYILNKGSIISSGTMNLILHSDLIIKDGKLDNELVIEGNWRYSQEAMYEYAINRELYLTQDLYIRRIVSEVRYKALKDLLPRVGKDKNSVNLNLKDLFESGWSSNEDADDEMRLLMGIQGLIEYPKPTKLIMKIIASYRKKEFIILDFFSGSATTADAVMQLNSEDNGNRKFIMVQLPELCNEKSEAYKNSYKNICEIGKERIRRAGEKIKEENKDKEGIESLDIGFKVFRVSDTNIRWISEAIKCNDGVEEKDIITQEELRENESYKDRLDFNPWFTDLDVVYEMMLKRQDIELTERIEKLSYIGDRTYLVGYTILVCLEENITKEMVRKISEIETSLSWIVFRDSAFGDDINLKTNTINLLRTLIKEKNPRNKNQKILWI
ncbi:site-specific DNA-methyltransferase [Clostridium perfringens]|uniref:site-specific DNA-methyltransferase n=1 Tax=Clostridium perfringens TaxID=1502 RepID=UPI0032DA1E7A